MIIFIKINFSFDGLYKAINLKGIIQQCEGKLNEELI